MTVLVLIASIETILIAALGTSIIAAVGQSTGSFTGVTQWAVYSYGGILVATTLAQCVIISIGSDKSYNARGAHLAAVADAQCAATFQVTNQSLTNQSSCCHVN